MAFTGYSYATGLAALGQGIDSWAEGMEKAEKRRLLGEAFKDNPQAAAAAMADPALGLGVLKNQEEEARRKAGQAAFDRVMGSGSAPLDPLGGAAPSTPPLSPLGSSSPGAMHVGSNGAPPAAGGAGGPYAGAVSKIESGARYDALGPVTKTGDRAYGRFQVMGANIPSWTQEVLGRSLTPQEFLNSQEAQDAVFERKFGQYAAKYGPEGAARAWFAGEGGMNDLGRRDQLGTSVGDYGKRFMAGLGGQAEQAPAATAPVQAGNPAAAADAQRVAREGGPRMVLSAENPAAQPGPDGLPSQPEQDAGTPPQDGRVRLAQGGTSDAPLPISPAQFLVQRQQGKDGLLQPPAPFRPPPPTPELQRLDQIARAYEAQARVDPSGHATQLASQYRQAYLQARNEQGRAALADWNEQTRLYREQQAELRKQERDGWTPVTDPAERARLGADPAYKGVILRQAGGDVKFPGKASTEVNIDQKGEGKFAEAAGQGIAKRFLALSEEGDSGQLDLATIGQLRALGGVIDNSTFPALRGWLSQRGVNVGEDIGAIQAFNSLIDKMTPAQRIPGTGATSDFDAAMFKGALLSLLQTPEGRNLIAGTLEGLAQYKIERARISEQALSGEMKPGEAIKALRALPSPDLAFKSGLAELQKAGKLKAGSAAGPSTAPPGPPPGAAEPAPPPASGDWQDMGGGIKIRRKQ